MEPFENLICSKNENSQQLLESILKDAYKTVESNQIEEGSQSNNTTQTKETDSNNVSALNFNISISINENSITQNKNDNKSDAKKVKYCFEDFEIIQNIGKGVHAEVYLAKNVQTDTLVALKVNEKLYMEKVF